MDVLMYVQSVRKTDAALFFCAAELSAFTETIS